MAESGDYTKSLKPFKGILMSNEAEYRKTTPNSRDVMVSEIAAAIREAAIKKGGRIAEDDILHKVSTYTLFKTTTGH